MHQIEICYAHECLLLIVTKFVAALAADGAIDEEPLSTAELSTVYGPLIERVNESLASQGKIIAQVQVGCGMSSQTC